MRLSYIASRLKPKRRGVLKRGTPGLRICRNECRQYIYVVFAKFFVDHILSVKDGMWGSHLNGGCVLYTVTS
ncbi:unnamed protein product [Lactuca virosa]|uniref:Uncharacterized protein n=1 Tax=Lactuca virosa TaxID=75947 RepID=A0AAU9ML23_9ASTR|nr:unnamed protein product [Lactuca virosa]